MGARSPKALENILGNLIYTLKTKKSMCLKLRVNLVYVLRTSF